MKIEVDTLNAVPSKRLFLSIIADYDLNRSICELVDNGLDVWVRDKRRREVAIEIDLDARQQTIEVRDNAGGLKRSELVYIVGPGNTGSEPTDETIGIFGVGTKRAVVALAQDIRVVTRYGVDETYQVEFDDRWLQDESWDLSLFVVDEIEPGTTIVQLHRLRMQVTDEAIEQLKSHLQATYAKFLQMTGVQISLNGEPLTPIFFDNWAYPPGYEPRRYTGVVPTAEGHPVRVEAIAGLSSESSPATGEYGVYVYCNDRLIARALKTFEVGFTKGYAGLPHPKVSLTKVLVFLNGDARAMPWNSSKSDISTKHEVFQALHAWLNQVVSDYAALSRIWMGDWPEKVFQHSNGRIIDVEVRDFPSAKKSYLPAMPKSRPRFADVVADKNRDLVKRKPWVKGLYEGVVAVEFIVKQKLEQKNRIALIVLDSTLEIAFKEYLVNDSGKYYSDAQLLDLFGSKHKLHTEVKKHVTFSDDTWKKIKHMSDLRNKFVHQRATAGVSDAEIAIFREVTEIVLKKLYKVKFKT